MTAVLMVSARAARRPRIAKEKNLAVEEARVDRVRSIPAGRFGDAAEFGEVCAFLCGAQAGYIIG